MTQTLLKIRHEYINDELSSRLLFVKHLTLPNKNGERSPPYYPLISKRFLNLIMQKTPYIDVHVPNKVIRGDLMVIYARLIDVLHRNEIRLFY